MTEFPVLGEPLAVELANTVVGGADGELDLLAADDAPDAWIRAHRNDLPAGAVEHQPSGQRLRRLRDALRELIEAATAARSPDPAAVDAVNAAGDGPAPRPQLVWSDDGPRKVDAVEGYDPAEATLAAIARSAIELLGGPDRERLRRCERSECVLVFVAINPRRRWCSAEVCGNRARVARHYRRHRRPASG